MIGIRKLVLCAKRFEHFHNNTLFSTMRGLENIEHYVSFSIYNGQSISVAVKLTAV